MAKKQFKSLNDFSLAQLRVIKQGIETADSKESLLAEIDVIIEQKEALREIDYNRAFTIDMMNIDPDYRELLIRNGIFCEADLLEVEDLHSLTGMTMGAYEQISWARDFFDMTPLLTMPESKKDDQLEVAKVIVKHANSISKKNNM